MNVIGKFISLKNGFWQVFLSVNRFGEFKKIIQFVFKVQASKYPLQGFREMCGVWAISELLHGLNTIILR